MTMMMMMMMMIVVLVETARPPVLSCSSTETSGGDRKSWICDKTWSHQKASPKLIAVAVWSELKLTNRFEVMCAKYKLARKGAQFPLGLGHSRNLDCFFLKQKLHYWGKAYDPALWIFWRPEDFELLCNLDETLPRLFLRQLVTLHETKILKMDVLSLWNASTRKKSWWMLARWHFWEHFWHPSLVTFFFCSVARSV